MDVYYMRRFTIGIFSSPYSMISPSLVGIRGYAVQVWIPSTIKYNFALPPPQN